MTESLSSLELIPGGSPSQREQIDIDLIARALPAVGPYGLWANLELFASSGEVAEIDLLVLGHHALYLIDIKHWHGHLSGHGNTWTLTPPGGSPSAVASPLSRLLPLANQVKHKLILADPALDGLRIEPILFVPDNELELALASPARSRIMTPRDLIAVLQRGELPNTSPYPAWEPVDEALARSVMRVLDGLRRLPRPGYGSLAEEAFRLHRYLTGNLHELLGPAAGDIERMEEIEEVAASWVVSCAFMRALEDRGLLERSALVSEQTDTVARQSHADAPPSPARTNVAALIEAATRWPGCAPILDAPHNPIWTIWPSEQGARALLDFFWPSGGRRPRWSFGRDAGDPWSVLYHELSPFLRKAHGWVATPGFVGALLLELTLAPILDHLQRHRTPQHIPAAVPERLAQVLACRTLHRAVLRARSAGRLCGDSVVEQLCQA